MVAARETSNQINKQLSSESVVFPFKQVYRDVTIENAQIAFVERTNALPSIHGNAFSQVNVSNQRRLEQSDATNAAIKHFETYVKLKASSEALRPILVLVPYSEAFKYAWRVLVATEEGSYTVWIDAENGQVVELLPEFSFDSAQGLRFNPSPSAPTLLQDFDVDAPSGGNYSLTLAGILQVINNGADGCAGNVTVAGGSGSADFNVAPINSTANVQTSAGANYNCRFQEVNAFATITWLRSMYKSLGSQTFPNIVANVNEAGNGNSFDGGSTLHFSIGNATVGNTAQVCPNIDKFSGAIDSTCLAHEFGHYLNKIQFAVSGGALPGSINEGLADWWACTMYNTDTFGAWYGQRCSPTESGSLPRQAEANDVFPRHRTTGGGQQEAHSDGQMICWALWNMRREFSDAGALGVLAANVGVMKALTTAGQGIIAGISDQAVHNSYVDLERQLVVNSGTDWLTEKIVSSFARAGLFLSDREAIIDIDDDFLNRNAAVPPTFTVWTGRDYTFDAAGNAVTTGTVPFNQNYVVEVANDATFSANITSSGTLGGVTAGQGGTATWQLPAVAWNVLKAGDHLYYRVRTTDSSGDNVRNSANAGDSTVTGMNPPFAIINNSGECECSCSTGSGDTSFNTMTPMRTAGVLFIYSLPFAYGFYRRSLSKPQK